MNYTMLNEQGVKLDFFNELSKYAAYLRLMASSCFPLKRVMSGTKNN